MPERRGYRFFALTRNRGGRNSHSLPKAPYSHHLRLPARWSTRVSNGRLLAVDAKSGKLLWDFQTEGFKQDRLTMLKPDSGLHTEAIYARILVTTRIVLAIYRVFSAGELFVSRHIGK